MSDSETILGRLIGARAPQLIPVLDSEGTKEGRGPGLVSASVMCESDSCLAHAQRMEAC